MARALMKKSLDDEVTLQSKRGETRYTIVALTYRQPD